MWRQLLIHFPDLIHNYTKVNMLYQSRDHVRRVEHPSDSNMSLDGKPFDELGRWPLRTNGHIHFLWEGKPVSQRRNCSQHVGIPKTIWHWHWYWIKVDKICWGITYFSLSKGFIQTSAYVSVSCLIESPLKTSSCSLKSSKSRKCSILTTIVHYKHGKHYKNTPRK